jgi:hypothetical protein
MARLVYGLVIGGVILAAAQPALANCIGDSLADAKHAVGGDDSTASSLTTTLCGSSVSISSPSTVVRHHGWLCRHRQ